MLQDYDNDLFLTENLLHNTRTSVHQQVFGNPDENIMYQPALAICLEECHHSFHVVKKTPFDVRKCLLNIIIQEKIITLANTNPPKQMSAHQKLEYVYAWQTANGNMLNDVGLGHNCVEGGEANFVTGLFLSTAAARIYVPLLQTVYQADAAHMKFGKYTLYSCYGITSNCNALPIAFGIVFENEDKEGWEHFGDFVKSCHSTIIDRKVTVITLFIGRRMLRFMSRVARENSRAIGIMNCFLDRVQWQLWSSKRLSVNATFRLMPSHI